MFNYCLITDYIVLKSITVLNTLYIVLASFYARKPMPGLHFTNHNLIAGSPTIPVRY